MLKKLSIRKIAVTSSALIVMGFIYLFPIVNNEVKPIENIRYIDESEIYEVYLIDKFDYVSKLTMPLISKEEIDILKEKLELLTINSTKTDEVPNGFKPIIPAKTKVLSLNVVGEEVTVDFSEELLNVKESDEEKMIEAIIYSLTDEENIKKVYIKVAGKNLERLPRSNKLLPIPIDRNYGINKMYDFNTLYGLQMTTVYYVNEINDMTYYVPVSKFTNDNREKITVIIDELKSSVVYQSNLSSYLNANAELKDYEIIEKTMYLTFNNKILNNVTDNNILEEVKYSISLSVKDNYDVSEVVFNVAEEEIN